jgi:hypothetical protein
MVCPGRGSQLAVRVGTVFDLVPLKADSHGGTAHGLGKSVPWLSRIFPSPAIGQDEFDLLVSVIGHISLFEQKRCERECGLLRRAHVCL